MKTLILNGSPRPRGDTAHLIGALAERLEGEIEVVPAYRAEIGPCIDCRACARRSGCAVQDGMQEVYRLINECDNLVIASPLHFGELSGPLLSLAGRLQTYWSAKYIRKVDDSPKRKRGLLILTGGGDGEPKQAALTAGTLFKLLNAESVERVYSLNTDRVPAKEDKAALAEIDRVARAFNRLGSEG